MLIPVVKNCLNSSVFHVFKLLNEIVFSASTQIVFQFSMLGRAFDVQQTQTE